MSADGDFFFQFPAYTVKRTDGKVFGYVSGDINGLPIYTDRESAIRAVGSTPGLQPFEYATSCRSVGIPAFVVRRYQSRCARSDGCQTRGNCEIERIH